MFLGILNPALLYIYVRHTEKEISVDLVLNLKQKARKSNLV